MNQNRIIRRVIRVVSFLTATALLLCCLGSAAAAIDAQRDPQALHYDAGIYTTDSNMNFRSAPSMEAEIIGLIPGGTVVLVDAVNGVWGHTTFEGKEGWLSLEYSSAAGTQTSAYAPGQYQTDEPLNFRSSAAELRNNVIGLVPRATVVTVTEVSGTWGRINFSGKDGWISLIYCSAYVPAEETTTAPAEEETSSPSETDPPSPSVDPEIPSSLSVDWLVLDVSRHNAVEYFDWPTIKAAGVEGVIIRAGGRGYLYKDVYDDVAFYQHYLGAKAAGLHVGAYFFSYALTEAEAVEEAQMTINVLRSCKAELDMPVYIDIEDYAESDHVDNQHEKAGKAVCTKVVDAFCRTIKAAGYYPGIYCNKNFAETLLDDSVFAGRSLWIAHYASKCGYTRNAVSMWQYGSSGSVDGYSGQNIDVNRCYVNYPAIISGNLYFSEHTSVTVGDPTHPWQTTAAPNCTADGKQTVTEDGFIYEEQLIPGEHGETSEWIRVGTDPALHAGQILSLTEEAGPYVSVAGDRYEETLKEAEKTGGCRVTTCKDCGEVMKIEYIYPPECEHVYAHLTVTAPTCAREGLSQSICGKCGKTGTETVLARSAHTTGELRYYENPSTGTRFYASLCDNCQTKLYASYNFIPGDVDGNLKTDASDARLALRHAIGLESIHLMYLQNADVNNDGDIDPADARLILRKSVNLE